MDWPTRHYKGQPQKIIPAKESYSVRQKTLKIREVESEATSSEQTTH